MQMAKKNAEKVKKNHTSGISKAEFINSAKPLPVNISGSTIFANPKQFSTGSVGFNITGKVQMQLPNGVVVTLQVSGNLTAIGSADWEDETPSKEVA
jgi:hypothetical protein